VSENSSGNAPGALVSDPARIETTVPAGSETGAPGEGPISGILGHGLKPAQKDVSSDRAGRKANLHDCGASPIETVGGSEWARIFV
jgi:hypothetical protein